MTTTAAVEGRARQAVTGIGRTLIPDRWLGIVLLAPSAIVFLVLLVFPLAYGIYTSFFQIDILDLATGGGSFVGLDNYFWLLGNPEFWHALKTSTIYAGIVVTLQIVLGTGVALLLHQGFKGRAFVRGLVLFPYMMPVVAVILVWLLLYNALFDVPFASKSLCNVEPSVSSLGIPDARLIAPGDVDRSVLWERMSQREADFMPPLGSRVPDNAGAAMLMQWIDGMSGCPSP